MPILLGLALALHACWPVLGRQLKGCAVTPRHCQFALLAGCVEIGIAGLLLASHDALAVWLFAALPSAVYLAAVSIDVLGADA